MLRRNLIFVVVFIVAGVLATFLYQKIGQDEGDQRVSVSQDNSIQITPAPSDEDHVLWKGSGDVVVVEYYDLDCPYCRSLLLEEDKLPDSVKNKVRLIYRWFPLVDIYPRSLERAIIAECVSFTSGEVAFFNFLRIVSSSYQKGKVGNDWLINMAKPFVNDAVYFEECVSKRLSLEKINRSRAGGYVAGIFSVPSFLVAKKGMPVKKFDLLGPISGSNLLKTFAGLE